MVNTELRDGGSSVPLSNRVKNFLLAALQETMCLRSDRQTFIIFVLFTWPDFHMLINVSTNVAIVHSLLKPTVYIKLNHMFCTTVTLTEN